MPVKVHDVQSHNMISQLSQSGGIYYSYSANKNNFNLFHCACPVVQVIMVDKCKIKNYGSLNTNHGSQWWRTFILKGRKQTVLQFTLSEASVYSIMATVSLQATSYLVPFFYIKGNNPPSQYKKVFHLWLTVKKTCN